MSSYFSFHIPVSLLLDSLSLSCISRDFTNQTDRVQEQQNLTGENISAAASQSQVKPGHKSSKQTVVSLSLFFVFRQNSRYLLMMTHRHRHRHHLHLDHHSHGGHSRRREESDRSCRRSRDFGIDQHQSCPSSYTRSEENKLVVLNDGVPLYLRLLPVEARAVVLVGGSSVVIDNKVTVNNGRIAISKNCNNHDDDDDEDENNKSDRRRNGRATFVLQENGSGFCVSSRRRWCCLRRRRRRRRRYNSFIRYSPVSSSGSSSTTASGAGDGPSSLIFVPVVATTTTAAVIRVVVVMMMMTIMILSVSKTTVLSEAAFTSHYYQTSYHHNTRHTRSGSSPSSTMVIPRRNDNNKRRMKRQEHGNVVTTKTTLQSSSSSLSAASTQSTTLVTNADADVADAAVVVDLEWTELFSPKQETAASKTTTTPVVFLHGLLGSKRNFASLATMLGVQLQTPRTIYGVDLRNHGDNKESNHVLDDGCMLYPHMARDVVQFLDSQRIEKCIVVGHSMGGKVGQALALLYPDRVEGLVVIDIAPVTYTRTNNPNWKAVEDILIALKETTTTTTTATTTTTMTSSSSESSEDSGGGGGGLTKQQVDKALRPAVPDPALRAFVLTNYDSHRCTWKIPITTLVRELENIAGFDLSDTTTDGANHNDNHHRHHQYDGDVFIIHGGQSKFVRHAYMDTIAQFFPNHLLTTIRGAGHWVHAEAPDDTVALLKRFLDR